MTISPDLYRGKCATVPDEAEHLMKDLNWTQPYYDLEHASEYLRSKGCEKIAVVGFCMGGALSLAVCVLKPQCFDVGVCFYGIPPPHMTDPSLLTIPMQFHFGDLDQSPGFSSKADVEKLKLKLKEGLCEVNQYPNADHAFMNEEAPYYPFNKEVAAIAYEKTISYLKKHIC